MCGWRLNDLLSVKLWKERALKAYIKLPIKVLASCFLASTSLYFCGHLCLPSPRGYFIVIFDKICYFLLALLMEGGGATWGRGEGALWGMRRSEPSVDLIWWLLERFLVCSLILGDYKKWYGREEIWFTEKGLLAHKRAIGLCVWQCRTAWKTGLD